MIEQQTVMGTLYRCESCRYNTLNPDYAAAHGRIHPPSAALDSAPSDEQQPVVEEQQQAEPAAPEQPARKGPAKRRRKET